MKLTEEQEALRATVREFAREVVAPVIPDHYEKHSFPYEIVRQMAAMGLFGLPFPEEYGGRGGGYGAPCVALGEMARGDSSVGTPLGAFITNSGTDITALVTVTALTGPDEISAIIVPSHTPGFTVGPAYSKVGWCASDTHPLHFDDVRVPAGNLLGQRGRGFAQFLRTLDEGRVAIAALATGLAQGCVDESVAYAKQRYAFGRPIGGHQAIAFKLADLEMRAHTARLAWYDAATRLDDGRDFKRAAAIAKLYASEVAVTNAREATQIHGGDGVMNEDPVAPVLRGGQNPGDRRGTPPDQPLGVAPPPGGWLGGSGGR